MANFTDARKAFSEGRFGEAGLLCREILAASPSNLDVKLMLAASEIRGGDIQAGADLMEELAQQEPELYEAQVWLALAYRTLVNPDRSLEAAARACQLRPYDAGAHNSAGQAQKDLMRLSDAEASFRKAAELDPKQPIFKFNLGSVLQLLGRDEEAVASYVQAVAAASGSADQLIALGGSLLEVRQFALVAECSRKAVELRGERFEANMLWAQSLMELGEIDRAVLQIDKAIAAATDESEPYTVLGSILNRKGLIGEAETAYRKSISVRPRQGHAYLGLTLVAKLSVSDVRQIETMRELAADPSLAQGERESLHYALGKGYEDVGEYENAMRHYDEGNRIAYRSKFGTRTFNREHFAKGIESTAKLFTRDLFEKYRDLGDPTEMPIFIVGMIRSGTTLLEQILSSHLDVEGAGEVEFWAGHGGRRFDPVNPNLQSEALRVMASDYLKLLNSLAPTAKHVTDKMPANLLALGLIHLALPKARILLMQRQPIDNCLSIYTTANRAPVEFYHDKGNIAFAYEQYAKLAEHWRSVLPSDILMTVDYEDLVAYPSQTIPAILDFCGLTWDPRCLQPQENRRIVATPSAAQVRQPIYTASIGRWRRFEPWLGELHAHRVG